MFGSVRHHAPRPLLSPQVRGHDYRFRNTYPTGPPLGNLPGKSLILRGGWPRRRMEADLNPPFRASNSSRMPITLKTHKMLWGRAANRCAICRMELVMDASETDDEAVVGEACHIVAQKEDGPRGQSPLTQEQRDKYANLILLCNVHHKQVDDHVQTLYGRAASRPQGRTRVLGQGRAELRRAETARR